MSRVAASSRISTPSLSEPMGQRTIVDFTDGTHVLKPLGAPTGGDVIYDCGTPSAGGRAYSLDSNGLLISFQSGTTAQYASAKYEPSNIGLSNIDLSGSEFLAVEIEVPDGTGAALAGLVVWITTQTGNTYTNAQNRTIASGSLKVPNRQVMVAKLKTDTWTLTGGGPTSLASIGKLEFRFQVAASLQNEPASIYIRKVYLGRNRPKIVMCWDDLYAGVYTYAYPALLAKGWKGTVFNSASHLDLNATFMTTAQVQTLYDAGWDVGVQQYNDSTDIPVNFAGTTGLTSDGLGTATWVNRNNIAHLLTNGQSLQIRGAASQEYNVTTTITVVNDYTFTYPISGTPTTPDPGWATCDRVTKATAKSYFQQSLDVNQAKGWTRGNQFASYSNGVTDTWTENWMGELGFTMARSTNINAAPDIGWDPRCMSGNAKYRLPAITMDAVTGAAVLANVDLAIARGCSIILYGHNIAVGAASLTMTTANFDTLIAGLFYREKQGLCDIVSFSQLETALGTQRVTA